MGNNSLATLGVPTETLQATNRLKLLTYFTFLARHFRVCLWTVTGSSQKPLMRPIRRMSGIKGIYFTGFGGAEFQIKAPLWSGVAERSGDTAL